MRSDQKDGLEQAARFMGWIVGFWVIVLAIAVWLFMR